MARILALLFEIDGQRYALDTRDLVEVISRVQLRPIHRAPPELAGVFVYRGQVVPVVDLVELLARRRCSERFSSRILIAKLPSRSGGYQTLGLLAENVTEAQRIEPVGSEVQRAGPHHGVAVDGTGMIPMLRLEALIGSAWEDALSLTLRSEP